jgi:WD40 repeat protein
MMQDTSPSVFTKEKLLRLNEIPTAIKFSPNGQYLAVGFANGSLALLDMSRLELAHLHNRTIFESIGILPVTSICWGRQSRSLVSCTLDGYVRIFDVPSGEYLVSHKLDQGSVPTDIELHPEDK